MVHIQRHIFYVGLLFVLSLKMLHAQTTEVTAFYNEYTQKNDLNFSEKVQLLDSLLQQENYSVDSLALAQIYYTFSAKGWKSNPKRSIVYADKALTIADSLQNYEAEVFVKIRYNKTLFLLTDQQYYKALKNSQRYIELYPNENVRLGKLYRLRGDMYTDLGDFENALANYDKSTFILKKNSADKELLKTYINTLKTLIETFVDTTDQSHIEKIQIVINELEIVQKTYEANDSDQVAINLNKGVFYDLTENKEKAINFYKKALTISKTSNDTVNIAKNLINLGSIYKNYNELAVAENYLLEAKNITKGFPVLASMVANNLADISQKKNKHVDALIGYQRAITYALDSEEISYEKLPTLQELEWSSNKLDVLGYLIDKANGWIAYYEAEKKEAYLHKALATFTLADQLVDVIYVESREDLSKLFWRKKSATFYPKAVEVCNRLQEPSKAFLFMEKNKAILLLENMTDATAKRLAKLPESVVEREQKLLKKIQTATAEIQQYSNHQNIKESLKNELFSHKKAYNSFMDSLEINYATYYQYKQNMRVVSLEEVQNTLQADEIILQYIIGKEKGFVALISAEKIQLKELPATDTLNQSIHAYKQAILRPLTNHQEQKTYEKLAHTLYQQLIPFKEKAGFHEQRLTIIADGVLQYIPFEALRTERGTYLIEEAEINYNYSLSSAAQLQKNKTTIEQEFIAIAPTTFQRNTFESLATSADELQELSQIFNANHYQYEQATKQRFTQAYGNYKIIHLSTHGGIENTIPWLAFYDEKITLDELYFTKNQAELVVLSACKTADGELKKGEGVMSLARGFFNAGAQSVVSSLWDINEKSSNEIIQEFYLNLQKGDTKSAALQKAKKSYLQKYQHTSEASPYYWSALIITGDTTPIDQKDVNYIWYILGAILLTGILVLLKFQKSIT